MTDQYEQIKRIEERIAELPAGYISKKTINGKQRYYLQWREDGGMKSKYIPEAELEQIEKQIEERKILQSRRKEFQALFPKRKENTVTFETNVAVGEKLYPMVQRVRDLKKREVFGRIERYLYGNDYTRVCAVYGLRRTGKTTMLFQAMAEMSEENFAKAAYIKARTTDRVDMIIRDLDKLWNAGFRYVFIDEITLMEDFIDSASIFSDIYTLMGMKIVLSGTDSLGFWFARDNELYDRVRMVHTTFIPFREYSRLLGIDSIDEYIRYGGTLRMGETDFDDEDLIAEDASFRDDESTRRYIDTAISRNIQHSLSCFEYGHYFSHLHNLYDAGELTGAINRIIEDMNHRFVLSVLTDRFKSHDLGSTAQILRGRHDREKRIDIYQHMDKEAVTKRLMELLDIRNREQQTVEITDSHIARIKSYLTVLDLIMECPVEYATVGAKSTEHVLFSQPGMRYCQAQALVYAVMKDEQFSALENEQKQYITECILEDVRGRMLEDIILLETTKALGSDYRVFKYRFVSGEYDMVVCNQKNNRCAVYEIKHSSEYVREQGRHLMNEEMLKLTSPKYGKLVGRYVLYLGETMDTEHGIAYRNVGEFLKALPEITLESGLEEEQ